MIEFSWTLLSDNKARFKRQISQMTNLMTMHVHEM